MATSAVIQGSMSSSKVFLRRLPFYLAHLVCFTAFFIEFKVSGVILAFGLYFGRMFFVTGAYHRYFSHRTYKTSRVFQFVLAYLAMTSSQKGVLWWAAHHRNHHKYSDTDDDVHSPSLRGFWWSHVGWILSPTTEKTDYSIVSDLAKYPELRWLNRWFLIPPVSLAVTLYFLGGWNALVWGFFISTVMLWHGSFSINSLAHIIGRPRYPTKDLSKNSLPLALVTMGEGWHNNHHYYMASTRQGFFWWEIDLTYYGLVFLSWLGLIWDLRQPPKSLIARRGT